MKVEKLDKDNIKEFMKDLALDDDDLESRINKLEYYGVRDEEHFILAFVMLPEDDRIAIRFVSKRLTEDKFLETINYLENSLVVKSHLIIQMYNEKYYNILDNNYRCKDICVSLLSDSISVNGLKEKYAEIDMYNIKYFTVNKDVICNLVKQNIQDVDIIVKLHYYFKELNVNNVGFIVSDSGSDLLKELGYHVVYKSYIIE